MTDVDSSDGVSSSFTYNERNTIESYTVKKNNSFISGAEYTYDSDGLLNEVYLDSANGTYFEYRYDSLNRLTRKSHILGGIPLQVNYSYLPGNGSNTTGLVSSILYSDSGYRYMPKLSYTYDNKGNILTVSQNDELHISYTYDKLDRLVREDNKDLNQTVTYTYDTRGNILKKEFYAYTTGTLGSVQDTITYTYDSTWKDKLIGYDGQSISYDSIGNPTSYRGYTLTWQKGRQLASLNTGSKALSFKYNIDGLRTQKKVGSTTYSYIWSSGLLMQQSDGTNTLKFSYSPDGKALEVDFNGTAYYYIYNLQGDVIGLYNTGGAVVVKYIYDSWGKLISTTGSLANTLGKLNPFRYRGYIYDDETGLYWLRSRYYDPEIGRFLNADGYVSTGTGLGGYNMFAYCGNNPIIYVDDLGTRQVIGIDACGGASNYKISPLLRCDLTKKTLFLIGTNENQFRRPNTGEPGSTFKLPNGDWRKFGPDGLPELDYDHDDHNLPNTHPHDENGGHYHDWDWSKDRPRQKPYVPESSMLIGVGLVAVCSIGTAYVILNNFTVVGIADDFMIGPLCAGISCGIKYAI